MGTAKWKGTLTGKRAESIASPEKYPNLFDQYEDSLTAEKFYKSTNVPQLASDYGEIEAITDRDLIEESIGFDAEEDGEEAVEHEAPAVVAPVAVVAAAAVVEAKVESEEEEEEAEVDDADKDESEEEEEEEPVVEAQPPITPQVAAAAPAPVAPPAAD